MAVSNQVRNWRKQQRNAVRNIGYQRLHSDGSKADLQSMLADAARNTAVEDDPRIDEFVRAGGQLWKGRRH